MPAQLRLLKLDACLRCSDTRPDICRLRLLMPHAQCLVPCHAKRLVAARAMFGTVPFKESCAPCQRKLDCLLFWAFIQTRRHSTATPFLC